MTPRPPTPPDVAQLLRNEAFFGCCRCGFPIVQYHHIIPYESDPHFRAEDMMVLCPNCHDMATKGALNEQKQRRFKAYPFNRKHGHPKGTLWINEAAGAVLLGDTTLDGEGCFVSVGHKCLVRMEVGTEGSLELSLTLFDKEDQLIVEVERNEWKVGDPSLWDLESDYQFLKLRSKPYDVLLEINCKKEPLRIRAQLWHQGTRVDCKPSKMIVSTPSVKGMTIRGGAMSGYKIAVSADGKASGIVPMNIHPDDPLFGANARRQEGS